MSPSSRSANSLLLGSLKGADRHSRKVTESERRKQARSNRCLHLDPLDHFIQGLLGCIPLHSEVRSLLL